jgi:hypothetical protein
MSQRQQEKRLAWVKAQAKAARQPIHFHKRELIPQRSRESLEDRQDDLGESHD